MDQERLSKKLRTFSLHNPETTCWDWHGQVSNSGHGRITIKDSRLGINKTISAETASYIAFIDEVPEGRIVRQTCNNRLCINPEHLRLDKMPII